MPRRPRVSPALALLASAGVALFGVAAPGGALAARKAKARPLNTCPTHPQKLPADAIAGAIRAALREAHSHRLYASLNLKGMRVTSATLGEFDERAEFLWKKCGHRVHASSVVVSLEFPAMLPSASLSEGIVVVARQRGHYRVWGLVH